MDALALIYKIVLVLVDVPVSLTVRTLPVVDSHVFAPLALSWLLMAKTVKMSMSV